MTYRTRLAAIDLDGTLLDDEKRISSENLDAVKEFQKHGGQVTLASGRMHAVMVGYAQEIGLVSEVPLISYNGAMIKTVGGALLEETPVAAPLAIEVVEFCAARRLHLNYYLDDVLYVVELSRWTELYYSRTGSVALPVGDLRRFGGQRPTKLLIIDDAAVCDALQTELTSRYGRRLYITKTDNEYLEFMDPTANKGRALETVARQFSLGREDCIAFGDGHNDVPMLEWAGRSYAMSNGKGDAIRAAHEVVNNELFDGVARGLTATSYEKSEIVL